MYAWYAGGLTCTPDLRHNHIHHDGDHQHHHHGAGAQARPAGGLAIYVLAIHSLPHYHVRLIFSTDIVGCKIQTTGSVQWLEDYQ